MLKLAQAKLDIRRADFPCILARLLQHLTRHIDADHTAGRADLAGSKKAIEAGAAAEIDHRFAWLQRADRLRIAAAETEIGAIGHRRKLGFRIAHLARFAVRSAAGPQKLAAGAQQLAVPAASASPP